MFFQRLVAVLLHSTYSRQFAVQWDCERVYGLAVEAREDKSIKDLGATGYRQDMNALTNVQEI